MSDVAGPTSYMDLNEGEQELAPPSSELLFRQIPAHLWDDNANRPSLHAFGPQSADKGKPSFARQANSTAQESRDWHNANAKSQSISVWACSVDEVATAGTRAVDDASVPSEDGAPKSPAHAYVDFRHLDKRAERLVRAHLFTSAVKRNVIPTSP